MVTRRQRPGGSTGLWRDDGDDGASTEGGPAAHQGLPGAHSPICRAVALGWQVAQLFHAPVHRGPASDPERGGHLPGRSEFPGASQSAWLGEQIQSQVTGLLARPPQVLSEAMSDVLAALTDPCRARDTTLDAGPRWGNWPPTRTGPPTSSATTA